MIEPEQDNTLPTPSMLALLASHYDSGLILCCGERLFDYCDQIAAAMPMTTRLVLNVETEQGFKCARTLSAKDIRVAIHRQGHLSFLDDISQYLFNLVVFDPHDDVAAMIEHILPKLMPGGLLVVLNRSVSYVQQCLPDDRWAVVDSGWSDRAVFIRAKSKDAQPTQRKGGRRARISRLDLSEQGV